jgi:NADH-quinone oxidoreductase subunit I
MYCGICVEVCPFDALHWSPAFEYTSYTYEGMVHEQDVLVGWQEHVLPPPLLVGDAEDKAKDLAQVAHDKRAEGTAGVIREADKKEAYLAARAGVAPHVASDTPPTAQPAMAAQQAPAAPVPASAAEAAAPAAPEAAAAQAPAQAAAPTAPAAAADTGGLPRIDPNNLPDGISPVERGRLKKLAVFQERGTAPPPDLVANLKHLLDQMQG